MKIELTQQEYQQLLMVLGYGMAAANQDRNVSIRDMALALANTVVAQVRIGE